MEQNINILLEKKLNDIFSLIDYKNAEEACNKYLQLIEELEELSNSETSSNLDESLCAQIYFSFAQLLISVSEIESSMIMLQKAQDYKVLNNQIESFIMDVFIAPNLSTFKNNYNQNIRHFKINMHTDFDDLKFFPIPTLVDNQFYFYDKTQKTIIDAQQLHATAKDFRTSIIDSFSDMTVAIEWDIKILIDYLNNNKMTCDDMVLVVDYPALFLSNLQTIEEPLKFINEPILTFTTNEDYLAYYKQNHYYLPRNILSTQRGIENFKTILDDLHAYRKTQEGRHETNVMLSICIPTFNRGKRALNNVLHILNTHYDEEIEIVVSDNGSVNNTKKDYDEIANHTDARITYQRQPENLGLSMNVCKVSEMAHGKFILLVSDEDLIYLDQLETILSLCREHNDDLGVIRSSHVLQGKLNTIGMYNKGSDAILAYMMTSNYISGLVFNRQLLESSNVLEYIKNNQDNGACYYYPHMIIELFVAQYGNILGLDKVLVQEGTAEKTEFETTNINENHLPSMPNYSTIENRLEQLQGFYNVVNSLEVCENNFKLKEAMTEKIIIKTIYLIYLAINVYYKKIDPNIFQFYYDGYTEGSRILEDLYSSDEHLKLLEDRKKNLGKVIQHYIRAM